MQVHLTRVVFLLEDQVRLPKARLPKMSAARRRQRARGVEETPFATYSAFYVGDAVAAALVACQSPGCAQWFSMGLTGAFVDEDRASSLFYRDGVVLTRRSDLSNMWNFAA
jgi:hypothetical protein